MNQRFIEDSKRNLGRNVDNYIRTHYEAKGKKARIAFADAVNNVLGIPKDASDNDNKYKKVSRWITGEVLPDLLTILAISKLLDRSVNDIFDKCDAFPTTKGINYFEAKTLKSLITNENTRGVTTIYIPFAFREDFLFDERPYFTREQMIDYYKRKAAAACALDRLKEYNALVEKGVKINGEKHFARFCSVTFIEAAPDELSQPILYTNTDDYYDKISELWEDPVLRDYYNAVYFEERAYCYDNYTNESIEKAFFHMQKAYAEHVYKETFKPLIEKGILVPCEPVESVAEFDDGFVEESATPMDKILACFTDEKEDYRLDTIAFSFRLKLSKADKIDILSLQF